MPSAAVSCETKGVRPVFETKGVQSCHTAPQSTASPDDPVMAGLGGMYSERRAGKL